MKTTRKQKTAHSIIDVYTVYTRTYTEIEKKSSQKFYPFPVDWISSHIVTYNDYSSHYWFARIITSAHIPTNTHTHTRARAHVHNDIGLIRFHELCFVCCCISVTAAQDSKKRKNGNITKSNENKIMSKLKRTSLTILVFSVQSLLLCVPFDFSCSFRNWLYCENNNAIIIIIVSTIIIIDIRHKREKGKEFDIVHNDHGVRWIERKANKAMKKRISGKKEEICEQ